jgi:peptidoglycan hydrolase-like protein with peptidoglycan-binding domain
MSATAPNAVQLWPPHHPPFRAGVQPGLRGRLAARQVARKGVSTHLLSGSTTLLGDQSEFQPNIADSAYVAWSRADIIRAMYGDAHDDNAWYGGARRADLWKAGIKWLGIYQYIVATQDAATQAQALVKLLGPLRKGGEMVIADIEEGSGSQGGRLDAWRNVIHEAYPWIAETPVGHAWCYSGEYFAQTHGLALDWVAAYGTSEPSMPHRLWQFTDSYNVPGVGRSDCSLFHGTVDNMIELITPGGSPPPPPPNDWTAKLLSGLPTLAAGPDTGLAWIICRMQGELRGTGLHLKISSAADLTIDGSFGPLTETAVKDVQKHYGIIQDGIVGFHTWSCLVAGGPGTPSNLPTISEGAAAGPAWLTYRLQGELRGIGKHLNLPSSSTLEPDGYFGPYTTKCVREVQGHYKLATDGIVGPLTWTVVIGG